MIILYLFIGIIASITGALPLGASNIAVINTTIKQDAKQAFKIAITAGIAEVILSYYALHCNMAVRDFFDQHMWVQVLIVILLMTVGGFLVFRKKNQNSKKKKSVTSSKYIMGFLLGILNPPVLIYWIVAYGIIDNHLMLSLASPLIVLFLFFLGVYLGKVITLYLYSRFSISIKHRVQNISQLINKVTGVLLILIGLAQAVKISF